MMLRPLLDFEVLWRGRRCPRRFNAYLSGFPPHDTRVCTWDALNQGSRQAMAGLQEGPNELAYQDLQEAQVLRIARDLLCLPREIQGFSLYEEIGETLREIGWLAAAPAAGGKVPGIHAESWPGVLSRLPGLFRPVIQWENLLCRPDFLLRLCNGNWVMVMVRSALRLKDPLIAEAEFTKAVCQEAGLHLESMWLLHCREGYRRPGEAAPQADEFFVLSPLGHVVKHFPHPLSREAGAILQAASRNQECRKPRDCPVCKANLAPETDFPVWSLHRPGRLLDLLNEAGIQDIRQIPQASPEIRREMKYRHQVQLEAVLGGQPVVRKPELTRFLEGLEYPLYFLDFESTAKAVPELPGLASWEHLPFLFSCHRLASPPEALGGPDPEEVECWGRLVEPGGDLAGNTQRMAEFLVEVAGDQGTILAYGAAFERACLLRLGRLFPHLGQAMEALAARVVDLQIPFQNFWYYHPLQAGRLSLKTIYPLLGGGGYGHLAVKNGGDAHLLYGLWSEARQQGQDYPAVGRDLEEYCKEDTQALVAIIEALTNLAYT